MRSWPIAILAAVIAGPAGASFDVPVIIRERFAPVRADILAAMEASPTKARLTALFERMKTSARVGGTRLHGSVRPDAILHHFESAWRLVGFLRLPSGDGGDFMGSTEGLRVQARVDDRMNITLRHDGEFGGFVFDPEGRLEFLGVKAPLLFELVVRGSLWVGGETWTLVHEGEELSPEDWLDVWLANRWWDTFTEHERNCALELARK